MKTIYVLKIVKSPDASHVGKYLALIPHVSALMPANGEPGMAKAEVAIVDITAEDQEIGGWPDPRSALDVAQQVQDKAAGVLLAIEMITVENDAVKEPT